MYSIIPHHAANCIIHHHTPSSIHGDTLAYITTHHPHHNQPTQPNHTASSLSNSIVIVHYQHCCIDMARYHCQNSHASSSSAVNNSSTANIIAFFIVIVPTPTQSPANKTNTQTHKRRMIKRIARRLLLPDYWDVYVC